MNRPTLISAAAAAIALMLPSAAAADGMSDMVGKLQPSIATSSKSSLALEYCIGLGISDWFQVGTLHGEKRTLIAGNPALGAGAGLIILVAIDDNGATRSVAYAANRAWNDRTASVIRSCA